VDVKLILPALLEAKNPGFRPIKYALFPPLGLAALAGYLRDLGVATLPRCTSPFDPGYDLGTLQGHLEQSAHLMATLKLSMACWMVANETVSRQKLAAARAQGVTTVAGGGPFEVALGRGRLPAYLDLCADMGFGRIEAGQGFTDVALDPAAVLSMAGERGLEVQFELGSKHGGPFTRDTVQALVADGRRWLDAGAVELVVEARESAQGVGLFDQGGRFRPGLADVLAAAFGLQRVTFEAPTKASQFALLDHFGCQVGLANVRLEELLRVEIYRRGLHADAYAKRLVRDGQPVPCPDRS
jgi:phosphosulfolactate synthase